MVLLQIQANYNLFMMLSAALLADVSVRHAERDWKQEKEKRRRIILRMKVIRSACMVRKFQYI